MGQRDEARGVGVWLRSPSVFGCVFDELKSKKLLVVGFGFWGTGSVTFLEEVVTPLRERKVLTRAPKGLGALCRMNEPVLAQVARP